MTKYSRTAVEKIQLNVKQDTKVKEELKIDKHALKT